MTPNKLPPLPERLLSFLEKHGGWQGVLEYVAELEALRQSQSLPAGAVADDDDLPVPAYCVNGVDVWIAEQLHAVRAQAFHDGQCEALRQSQSLPAGAVAGLVGKWREEATVTRASAGRAQRRGDEETADVNFAFAQNLESCADELEQALQADAREKGEAVVTDAMVERFAEAYFRRGQTYVPSEVKAAMLTAMSAEDALDRAVEAFDDVYEAEYLASGPTDNKRAAISAAIGASADQVIALLLAGGFVSPDKVEEARSIIAACATQPAQASEQGTLRRDLRKLADYWIGITRDQDIAHRDKPLLAMYDKALTKCATELRAKLKEKE